MHGWLGMMLSTITKNILSSSIISKIMHFIYLAQAAQPFSRIFCRGDMLIAAKWQISVPSATVGIVIIVYWTKPPQNYVKVNTYSSYYHYSKRVAAGGVVRDADGRIMIGYHFLVRLLSHMLIYWGYGRVSLYVRKWV